MQVFVDSDRAVVKTRVDHATIGQISLNRMADVARTTHPDHLICANPECTLPIRCMIEQ
jgi:hypothetical protein